MNKKGITFVHIMIVLFLLSMGGILVYRNFSAQQPQQPAENKAPLETQTENQNKPQEPQPTAPAKARKKYQGVKVLGQDALSAQELAALQQATGKSIQELTRAAAAKKRAAAVQQFYKTNLTDADLPDMQAFSGPKVLIFYADWCPYCRRMKPVFEQLAKEYAGRAAVFAFNVEKAPKTYAKYSPRGVPSLVFYKQNNKKHSQTQGEQPIAELRKYMNAILK